MADFNHTLPLHEVRRIAADAFVFGLPLVLVDLVRRAHPVAANQVLHLPDDAADVAPGLREGDPRMVQSTAWIDLAGGPMVISLPSVGGRVLSVTLIDPWGETVPYLDEWGASIDGRKLAIVGPEWRGESFSDLPVLRVDVDVVWMVSRLVARTVADREAARNLLALQRIRPGHGEYEGPAFAPPMLEAPPRASIEAIAGLPPEIFFHRMAMLLARYPPKQMLGDLAAFAQIGLVPGEAYAAPSPDSKAYQAAVAGLADGLARVRHAATPTRQAGGWRLLYARAPHHDHLARAAAALSGLGAAAPESIMHLICETDSEGRPLNGAEHYQCRFLAGEAPPVDAFWSLSLHRRPSQGDLLLHRHVLGGDDRLQREPNGDLKLLIQHTPPSSGQAANWLPAPQGEFSLLLRLHRPREAALNGAWAPPSFRRMEASHR